MPEHIRRPGEQRGDRDPLSQLTRCHDRIRDFAALALRLPPGEPATDDELGEAAADVLRYFTVALPRHERDEEDSITPLLIEAGAAPELVDALSRMKAEHGPIGQVVADAEPLWTVLAHEPEKRLDLGPRLASVATTLSALFDVHLPAEEQVIFPAVGRLPPAALERLAAEMRARRDK